jgi:hypothetical protein
VVRARHLGYTEGVRPAALPLFVLASISCSTSPPAEPAGPPGTTAPPAASGATASPEAAIEAFKAAWSAKVMKALPEKEQRMAEAIDASMRAGKHPYRAKPESCRLLARRAPPTNTVTGHDFVIHGRSADVSRDGDCWAVTYEGGMKHEVLGVLDAGGALLVVWRLPEG